MDKITIDNKVWYTLESYMQAFNIKSNKTIYNKVEAGKLIKKKILGKTLFSLP